MSITPLNRFIRASDAVIKFGANFNDFGEEMHTLTILEAQKSELGFLWEKVKTTYEKCLDFLEDSDESEPSDIEVVAPKYQATYVDYLKCFGAITDRLDILKAAPKNSDFSANSDNSNHNLTLPPCDIDTFVGDYISWPAFRDLFSALYIKSSRLSNIERMMHLLRKTDGEAKDIVSKCPLSNEGFEIAWRSLKNMYENPRMLVNNQLKHLFNIPSYDRESSIALKTLQRGINGCLSAMSMYDVPTDGWDPIIVFLCIQRLPQSTVSLWEHTVKEKSVLSSWKDLDYFLTERIQTLDCLNDLKGSDTSKNLSSENVSVHFRKNISSNVVCMLCPNRTHYLRNCQRFRNLSASERLSVVNRNNCCRNCLSRTHNMASCKSDKNCLLCNSRHHTMLHPSDHPVNDSGAVLRTPNPILDQTASTSTGITSQTFHSSQGRSVLLGTAMVNVIHNGNKYTVRALLDPASESSFVTEGLQRRLNLETRCEKSRVSGINYTVSTVSKKVCNLKIGSEWDSSVTLNATALVLPTISRNLPSCSLQPDMKKLLPNLYLADFNPFESRPIEILIGADLYPEIILPDLSKNVLGSLLAQKTIFGWILTGPVNTPIFISNLVNNPNETPNLCTPIGSWSTAC